jgi:DNA-binding MarR family transcriptional regulator/GNAT superfamily N-acetyltransferase
MNWASVNKLLAFGNQFVEDDCMDTITTPALVERVETVREFNRFYTRRIGVLQESLLHSDFTLTESRLLWELAHCESTTATGLARSLELDPGYLSRLLRSFKERGLIKSTRSKDDARNMNLSLTAAGKRAFAPLDIRSQQQVSELLERLAEPQQQQLLQAFGQIGRLLDNSPARAAKAPYLLRPHRPGDMGWVVSRHGALYAQEYRWDMHFEALVARIAADFVDHFEAQREACWIAERDGVNVGCVFLVQARDDTSHEPLPGVAQLRMLLVEPSARGLGLGARLVAECTRFAQQAGYRSIRLWTNSLLTAARHIYETEGYRLIASEKHHSFGHDLVGETWEMTLP